MSAAILAASLVTVVAPGEPAAAAAWSPPAVSFVGAQTAFSAGGSTASVGARVPAGAKAGDTLIVSVSAERALRPVLGGVTGLTTVHSATDGTAITAVTAYKTLTAADAAATVTASVTTIRRMSLVVAVYRNVGSVVTATAGKTVQSVGATAVSTPAVTADRPGGTLVGIANYLPGAVPWTTTFTPSAAWTERADVVSTHPAAWNAATWLVERRAGAGGATGGNSYTGGGHYFASTFALGPRTEEEFRSSLVPGVDEPTAEHTGVLPDVPLEVLDDNLVIRAPGTYQNLDVQGRISVLASDVVIRNVRVRGVLGTPNYQSSMIDVRGPGNVLIEHVTVRPDVPHTGWNSGVTGWNFTLRFADISGTIDGVNVFHYTGSTPQPTNVVMEQNYIHDLVFWTADASRVVHPTTHFSHNDAIQFQGGSGAVVRGNSLHAAYAKQTGHWQAKDPTTEPYEPIDLRSLPDRGPHLPLPDRGDGNEANGRYNVGSQATIMISHREVPTHDLTVTDNWLYGGNQSVNGAGNPYTAGLQLGSFLRNRFDRSQGLQENGGDTTQTLSLGRQWAGRYTATGNIYMDTGTPVTVR